MRRDPILLTALLARARQAVGDVARPRSIVSPLLVIAICCWAALPKAAQANGAESFSIPFDSLVEVTTCPDFGSESAQLIGTVHVTVVDVTDGSGDLHFVAHESWEGASLTGLTSGTSWRYVSSMTSQTQGGFVGTFATTLTSTAQFVAPGAGNNLQVKTVIHMTFDAN